jgi:hypothetical protein
MTNRIHRICQVIEVATPRWTFERGIRDAACEALAALRHDENDRMEHSQYHYFPSRAHEGAEAILLPAEGHDCEGCLADQVKLTHSLA